MGVCFVVCTAACAIFAIRLAQVEFKLFCYAMRRYCYPLRSFWVY